MTRCLVTAQVAFPAGMAVAEPADEPGGLPKRFERTTRVPPRHGVMVDGIPVSVGPTTAVEMAQEFLPQHDLADVNLLVEGDLDEAASASQSTLDAVIDALAFQMQTALHVVGLSVLNVTAPLLAGE